MSSIKSVPNIYILGTSELGMSRVPVKVTSDNDVYTYFGTKGSLIDAYRKLKDVTAYPDIYLCKVNGIHATGTLNIRTTDEIIHGGITVLSTHSSKPYDISIVLTDEFMQIVFNNYVLEYSFSVYKTVHDLFNAINKDAEKMISPVSITNNTLEEYHHPSYSLASCNSPVTKLSESYNGVDDSKLQMYFNITKTLNDIKGHQIDHIIFADCYADDYIKNDFPVPLMLKQDNVYKIISKDVFITSDSTGTDILNFYDLMMKFCYEQYKFGIITKGIIGFNPINGTPNVQDYVGFESHIRDIQNKYAIDDKYLAFISLTCGDVYYDNGGTIDNHYIAYAGVITSEKYTNNITNIDYGDNIKYRHIFNSDDINALIGSRFILTRHSPLTDKTHIVNAVTLSTGCLANEFVFRTLQIANKLSKIYLDKYIGESVTKSLSKNIENTLKDMFVEILEETCATKYEYKVNYNNEELNILCELYFPGYLSPIKFSV